jgi:hypothetical protein
LIGRTRHDRAKPGRRRTRAPRAGAT